jgi:hypothetical protein
MILRMRHFFFALLVILFTACGSDEVVRLGPQYWNDLQIVVETRPPRIRAGMNEFIVIASRERNKPGVGLVVSIRAEEKGEWRQAIQDGYTGVYRRAVKVSDPHNDVLSVHIRNTKASSEEEEAETILQFPLAPVAE